MITTIQPYKQTSFKAVPKITRNAKAIGETKFVITNQVGAIKSALIDILKKTSNNEISDKLKGILEKYQVSLNNGIIFASIAGIEKAIILFLDKNKEGQDCLGIKSEKDNISYIFNKNNVIKQDNNGRKYLTQEEIDEASFENFIMHITNEVDFPLLEIRRSFLPPVKPYIPKRVYKPRTSKTIQKNTIPKTIKVKENTPPQNKKNTLPPIILESEKDVDTYSLFIQKVTEPRPIQKTPEKQSFFNRLVERISDFFKI